MLTAFAEVNNAPHAARSINHTLRDVVQGPHALGLDCRGGVGRCRLHAGQRGAQRRMERFRLEAPHQPCQLLRRPGALKCVRP